MKRIHIIALAAALAAPASVLAQAPVERIEVPADRVIVYDLAGYQAFLARTGGALQSGGATLADTVLADNVAMAIADDPYLKDVSVTVAAHNGRVSLSGQGNQAEAYHVQRVAKRVAGVGSVSGELASDLG